MREEEEETDARMRERIVVFFKNSPGAANEYPGRGERMSTGAPLQGAGPLPPPVPDDASIRKWPNRSCDRDGLKRREWALATIGSLVAANGKACSPRLRATISWTSGLAGIMAGP